MVRVVGDHGALEAPLIAKHACEQGFIAARPCGSDAVVRAHEAGGPALLDSQLEGSQVNLAQGLLRQPLVERVAVGVLIVQREVLDVAVRPRLLGARDDGRGEVARHQRIFREVLVVAPTKRRAVDVDARGVQAVYADCRRLTAQLTTILERQPVVPGLGDHGAARVADAHGELIEGADLRRAVNLLGKRLSHVIDRRGGNVAVKHELGHLVDREVVK